MARGIQPSIGGRRPVAQSGRIERKEHRMHAEYKVPGGKLVVVDLDVDDDVIRQARLSGDFFLEPPETLALINEALLGLSVHSSAEEIAAQVSRNLPRDTEMFGVDPQAIGVVVRRALA